MTEGLANIEKAEAELNNIACLGYEDGERVLWGGTQRRGKIWQAKTGTVSQWMGWTATTWAKVTSEDKLGTNITRDFLRPQRMDGPHASHPIAAQWGEQAQMRQSDRQAIIFGGSEVPLIMVNVDIAEVTVDGAITLRLTAEGVSSEYQLTVSKDLSGGYRHEHVSGPAVRFRKARDEAITLEEYLQKDPFIVRYADGTYSYNCYHIATKIDAGVFDKERLEAWDWTGIPLNKESMHKARDQVTIQYRSYVRLDDEYDLVFNDDGHGNRRPDLSEGRRRVDDSALPRALQRRAWRPRLARYPQLLYRLRTGAEEHHGQAQGPPWLYHDLKRRHDAWVKVGTSRFLKGDMKGLTYFKEKARRAKLQFEVVLVQPGASVSTITERMV